MNNTNGVIYGSLPVRDPSGVAEPNDVQRAILVRDSVVLEVQEFIDQSDLWENDRVNKALRIFPVVGFLSAAALTMSYATAYFAYGAHRDDLMDRAITAAKWSQVCLLGNLGAAIGVRLLSKVSGKWTSETRRLVLNTLAGSFPCIFARVVCCEVEPGSQTITVLREPRRR